MFPNKFCKFPGSASMTVAHTENLQSLMAKVELELRAFELVISALLTALPSHGSST